MRQFISPVELDKKGLIELSGKDYKYIVQVLRAKAGDMIYVRLPSGDLIHTTVCKIDQSLHHVILQFCSVESTQSISSGVQSFQIKPQPFEYWLFQFVPALSKMELIVRQAAECGVKNIVPITGRFCKKGSEITTVKYQRFERIIKEARQQSASPVDTKVLDQMNVEEACKLWQSETSKNFDKNAAIVLWERNENTKNLHEILSVQNIKKIAIAVGAEGGISEEEIKILRQASFIPVHFAVNILRCETAALFGIAAVQSIMLENNKWRLKE